ncbi:MAG: hypothetical protein ACRC46_04275 [Thermoguttaceae bacterium]
MGTRLNSFETALQRLTELAACEPAPKPLDVAALMNRIERCRAVVVAGEESLRLFAGVGFVATAAAALVLFLAVHAWSEMSNPAAAMDSLMDVFASSSIVSEALEP